MDLLKPINEKEFKSIIKIQVNFENIDECYEKYTYAILDVYDHQLSVDDAEQFLSSFQEHNLKHEYKFLNFIRNVYEINKEKPIVVETSIDELTNIEIIRILDGLDFSDKLIFIDLIKNNKLNSNLFFVSSIEAIVLLAKLSTRELLFSTFHFINIQASILGNYDLSFPVFFYDKDSLNKYLEIAKENDLFLRNIKISDNDA